jgi:hypothetical protein
MTAHSLSMESHPSVSVTELVVTAVSDAEDCDPLALSPLWDVIDPEALDGLFAPTRHNTARVGHIEFVYAGYGVSVAADGDGSVSVSLEALDGDELRQGKK